MQKSKDIKKIKCAIFNSKNEAIEGFTKTINETEDMERKVHFAGRLIKEVDELLACNYFDEKELNVKFVITSLI